MSTAAAKTQQTIATSTPSYSTQQIIHTFNCSANSTGSHKFANFGDMQAYATTIAKAVLADPTIQGLIGNDWTPVWGPVVYSKDTTGKTVVADNTMGCYYSHSQNMFVIAVAGTNPLSTFDWLSEDLGVSTLVPWASVSTGHGANSGNISVGTKKGLEILLAMTDSGSTLLAALLNYINTKSNNATGAKVVVCGHSLAGALSPCLALYMVENGSVPNANAVSAYPTAGPTPGDNVFATYYGTMITGNSPKITYVSLYNSLDVVPHAWAPGDLAAIPSIYGTKIYDADVTKIDKPPDEFMGILVSALFLDAAKSGKSKTTPPSNTYTQITRSELSGSFSFIVNQKVQKKLASLNPNQIYGSDGKALDQYTPYLTAVAQFGAQAAYQHTDAYWGTDGVLDPGLLGIGAFEKEYKNILKANPPTSAEEIDLAATAVKNLTGIDLGSIDT